MILKWNSFLIEGKESLLAQLKARISALKKISKTASRQMLMKLANGLYMSKLLYGSELWLGAPAYMLKTIQKNMNAAARLVLGFKYLKMSVSQLMANMKWNNLTQLLKIFNARLAHQALHFNTPEMLAFKLSQNPDSSKNVIKKL